MSSFGRNDDESEDEDRPPRFSDIIYVKMTITGGIAGYHDSYTFEMFSLEPEDKELVKEIYNRNVDRLVLKPSKDKDIDVHDYMWHGFFVAGKDKKFYGTYDMTAKSYTPFALLVDKIKHKQEYVCLVNNKCMVVNLKEL